jgi:hypothetical protein
LLVQCTEHLPALPQDVSFLQVVAVVVTGLL